MEAHRETYLFGIIPTRSVYDDWLPAEAIESDEKKREDDEKRDYRQEDFFKEQCKVESTIAIIVCWADALL
jgi:hypothetical protein